MKSAKSAGQNTAGIYIHIPFCKQACHYCNFHFSTSMRYKSEMIEAMLTEIELQKDYLENLPLQSVYFGGGTPSVLETSEIEQLLQQIEQFHDILPNAEITLEANPDDLTMTKLQQLSETRINRLSIGVQSFFDKDLKYMNRVHNSNEAIDCIKNAQRVGFQNLTIDLIYGTPTMTNKEWRQNLQTIFDLNVPHISCYCLTVEPKTALEHFVKTGKSQPVDEQQAAEQFQILVEEMTKNGYIHYEISNFAKPDFFAIHNSNYWKGKNYLGIGPSAHSFNGESRQWNVAHNQKYIKSLEQNQLSFEVEVLSKSDQFNEYLMTGLRTIWGVNLDKMETFGTNATQHFLEKSKPYLQQQLMIKEDRNYKLTSEGRFLSDGIISELFLLLD
ncbi:MAG: radical SAM family heme chaperone HemW [Saprospiraceae bacterium]